MPWQGPKVGFASNKSNYLKISSFSYDEIWAYGAANLELKESSFLAFSPFLGDGSTSLLGLTCL